jgi:hypothetical protein
VLSTCSQMLWIKNKATQLLIIKDLRPSKHYLLGGIMLLRRESRTYFHHINTRIGTRRGKYDVYVLIIHLFLHSIKHVWISTMLILHWYLRLARRRGCERVNTIQREQYSGTVHLFIGTRRSPGKSTFMSLTSIYSHNMNHQGLNSLLPLFGQHGLRHHIKPKLFRLQLRWLFLSPLGYIFTSYVFAIREDLYAEAKAPCNNPYTENTISHIFEDLRNRKAPNRRQRKQW